MWVLPIIAALTLAQADAPAGDPLRPETTTTAPPRADTDDRAAPEVGFGGTEQDEAGTGGSGKDTSALQQENERLREELQQMRRQLETANQSGEKMNAELEEMNEEADARWVEEQSQRVQQAERENTRDFALQAARDRLVYLRPDVLHDSGVYESALEAASQEVENAANLKGDEATMAAQRAISLAHDAFDNGDMFRMWQHSQQAILELERAATLAPPR